MELVRQIKQAEEEARQLVAEAKDEAVGREEALKAEFDAEWRKFRRERKEALDCAEADGREQGEEAAKALIEEAEEKCRALREGSESRGDKAATHIMEYLKG